MTNKAKQLKPKGAECGIEDYKLSTIVAASQEIYHCNIIGPESSLSASEAYKPTGKYGAQMLGQK